MDADGARLGRQGCVFLEHTAAVPAGVQEAGCVQADGPGPANDEVIGWHYTVPRGGLVALSGCAMLAAAAGGVHAG